MKLSEGYNEGKCYKKHNTYQKIANFDRVFHSEYDNI